MKLKDQYTTFKNKYRNSIVLIRSGSFIVTYGDDAVIFKYLFSYQIRSGKLGFPISVLDKVLLDLDDYMLNYVVLNLEDNDILNISKDDRYYFDVYNKAKKSEFEDSMNQILLDRIKYLIDGNVDNYDKIKRFVDEL